MKSPTFPMPRAPQNRPWWPLPSPRGPLQPGPSENLIETKTQVVVFAVQSCLVPHSWSQTTPNHALNPLNFAVPLKPWISEDNHWSQQSASVGIYPNVAIFTIINGPKMDLHYDIEYTTEVKYHHLYGWLLGWFIVSFPGFPQYKNPTRTHPPHCLCF